MTHGRVQTQICTTHTHDPAQPDLPATDSAPGHKAPLDHRRPTGRQNALMRTCRTWPAAGGLSLIRTNVRRHQPLPARDSSLCPQAATQATGNGLSSDKAPSATIATPCESSTFSPCAFPYTILLMPSLADGESKSADDREGLQLVRRCPKVHGLADRSRPLNTPPVSPGGIRSCC